MNIITLERISKVFTERKVFEDTDFYLQEGEKVGVVGINGTGKTTLLRIIGGLEEPDDGKVIRANHLVIRYLPQHPEYQPEDDMLECITKGLTGEEKVNTQTQAKTMLTGLGINDFTQKAGTLSGGQQKRLALVEVLLSDADVLLLDEPTNHLDLPSKEVLQQALAEYEGTLLIVSHDRYLLDRVPNRIFSLEQGKLVQYKGGYGDYLRAAAQRQGTAPVMLRRVDSEQKKQYNRGKEQRREDARRRKAYADTEAAIHTLESELESIKAEMAQDEVQNDYQRLQELCGLLEEKQALLDTAMEHWLVLSDELGLNG